MVILVKYLHLNGPFLITSKKLLTDKLNMYFYFMVLAKGEAAYVYVVLSALSSSLRIKEGLKVLQST